MAAEVVAMKLSDPIYSDENKAREHLEKLSWPHGPFCPHCGNTDPARLTKLKGKSTRPGVYKCKECRKPFSVTVGTVMERSKIPLGKWLAAMHLMTASKKGMSAHQLARMIGVTYEAGFPHVRPARRIEQGGRGRRDVHGRQGEEPRVQARAEKIRRHHTG